VYLDLLSDFQLTQHIKDPSRVRAVSETLSLEPSVLMSPMSIKLWVSVIIILIAKFLH